MGWSKVRPIFTGIGILTVLYLGGDWAIGVLDDVRLWLQSTGVSR